MREYYWFQRNYFVVAVDAVSLRDAQAYARVYVPGARYQGKRKGPVGPTTACGAVTSARQEEIIANNMRIGE